MRVHRFEWGHARPRHANDSNDMLRVEYRRRGKDPKGASAANAREGRHGMVADPLPHDGVVAARERDLDFFEVVEAAPDVLVLGGAGHDAAIGVEYPRAREIEDLRAMQKWRDGCSCTGFVGSADVGESSRFRFWSRAAAPWFDWETSPKWSLPAWRHAISRPC